VAAQAFPFRPGNFQPVGYDAKNGIGDLFYRLQDDFGWQAIIEEGRCFAVQRRNALIKIEAGCQLSLSGAGFATLHESAAGMDQILLELNHCGHELGMGFLGIGFHPTARREDIPVAPFPRFRIAQDVAAQQGEAASDALFRSCGAQIALNYASEADMAKKFRVALAMQPVVTALFACSPFCESAPSDAKSLRQAARVASSSDYGELVLLAFDPGFGFERYVEWTLNRPLPYTVTPHDAQSQCFRDLMRGEGVVLADWLELVDTADDDVGLGAALRMNGADSGPAEMILALSAFWTGLLYDEVALDSAWAMIESWKLGDLVQMRKDAPRFGLDTDISGFKLSDIAQVVLSMAHHGLRRRANRLHGGADEGRYLDVLIDYADSHHTRADQFLMQREHFPTFSMQTIFDSCRLTAPPQAEPEPDDIVFV